MFSSPVAVQVGHLLRCGAVSGAPLSQTCRMRLLQLKRSILLLLLFVAAAAAMQLHRATA